MLTRILNAGLAWLSIVMMVACGGGDGSTGNPVSMPLFDLPAGAQLASVEHGKLLYTTGAGAAVLHDMDSATERVLEGAASLQGVGNWQLSGGRVYVRGKGADCTTTLYCIYEWDAQGVRVNLTVANPFAGKSQEYPVARSGYVVWSNASGIDPGSFSLFNVAMRTYTQIAQPEGTGYLGNVGFDFAVVNGVVHLFFSAQTGGPTSLSEDMFAWRSDTGVSTRLSSAGTLSFSAQTDGIRAVWQQRLQGTIGASSLFSLLTVPVSGAASTLVSAAVADYRLNDGVLAWSDGSAGAAIKASTSGGVPQTVYEGNSLLYANGGGHVVYGAQGKLFSWNAATGASTLRLDVVPTQFKVLMDGNTMVFMAGQTVYRVALL